MILVKNSFFLGIIFSGLFILFLFSTKIPLYDDEPRHFDQINLFIEGKYEIITTSIPVFHLIEAQFAKIFHSKSLHHLRFFNLLFSFLNIYIFFLIASKVSPSNNYLKTLQFAFLPVLFPYRFLLYTENLSLLFILLATYWTFRNKFFVSFIFAVFAVLTKQLNIVWYLFIFLFIYFKEYNSHLSFNNINLFIKEKYYFIAGLLGFAVFIYINRGVALITKDVHPDFYLSLGNFYWAIFLFFLLFLPLIINRFYIILGFICKKKIILIPVITFLITALFTFRLDHPWNQYPEHLRNGILLFFMSNIFLKLIFFNVVILTILIIYFIHLKKNHYYLLYPFMLLSLLPIWLIETRYSLPFFVFFILFREDFGRGIEFMQSLFFIVISILLFNGYLNQSFYL